MNKKLYLIFHGRFPSEKAASLFAAKSAEAFARVGYDVTLLVPQRETKNEDPFDFYSVERNFTVERISSTNLFILPMPRFIAFWVSYYSFSRSVRAYLLHKNIPRSAVIYSNELLPLWYLRGEYPNTFYEMHDFPESKKAIVARMLSTVCGIVVHNAWKRRELARLIPQFATEKMLLEPNAVDTKTFGLLRKEEARKQLSLPNGAHIALYTGHLYAWKGVDTLAMAAALIPEVLVVFVGGTPEYVQRFWARYGKENNIRIMGQVPHDQIPAWQSAADLLILPNTAQERISALYTSPMKLFEYMASKRPIIASDLPSIRELITPTEAVLIPADNPSALAEAIRTILADPAHAEQLSEAAHARVQGHTWDMRAARIAAFISALAAT